jgi:hypothetical protein
MKRSQLTLSILPLILVAVHSIFMVAQTFSAEPPKDPIIVAETGMHFATIDRIASDAYGKWLVTASEDESLRVWELPVGKLFRTIRPPVGMTGDGRLASVALSPDGATIACGGYTGTEWDKTYSIYLFNLASGKMIGRCTGLTNVIRHIAFSPDGRFLAATLWGQNGGVHLFQTSNWSQTGEDREYGNHSVSAHFSRDSRLVTTSFDGYLRLYEVGTEGSLRLTVKVKAPNGNIPYAARFSPDGSKVAVGYHDTASVSVLSGRDLSLLFSPNTSGVDNGASGSIAWSSDGRYLFAGGTYRKIVDGDWNVIIQRWSDGGRGIRSDFAAADNTIMDLAPLPDGRVAYASFNPAIGILDQTGKRILFVPPPTADFRDNGDGFRVSSDGSKVSFSYEKWGKSPASFDLNKRGLTLGKPDASLKPPLTMTDGLTITNWKHSCEPKLNNVPLQLEEFERSRSLTIAPNGKSFILGTSLYLRHYDHQGNLIWKTALPGEAWAVNVTGNGSIALAGLGNGAILWVRMSDGKWIFGFFPHADKKRWVLWTYYGYYDASVGGEDFIGWQVNRGRDQAADFFPASRFRDTNYRPDIFAKILVTLDVDEAVRLANAVRGVAKGAPTITQILPPVIEILDPIESSISTTSQTVTLRYRVRSPSGAPVNSVRALVNTRPIPTPKGIPVASGEKDVGEVTVTVPEEDCEIALIAENRNASSVPATIRVLWKGKPLAKRSLPRLLMLAVGIGKYEDDSLKLNFAAKDADDFVSAFKQQEGLLYSKVITKEITDTKAKKDNILDGLEWLKKETTSRDIAVIFLSGHGTNDQAGQYYFLPQNAAIDNLTRTGLELSTIRNTVAFILGRVLLFLDTCHSGSVDFNGIVNTLTGSGVGAVVFASSAGNQKSWEREDWKNGAFTKALVEGLNGAADYKGKITITSLDLYVSDRVKELTAQKQTPVVGKPTTIPDFQIAEKKKGKFPGSM